MKIISWNVNWIRAVVKKNFIDFFNEEKPDIFCIQETKAFLIQLPTELSFFLNKNWYKIIRHNWEKPWYAWTAIFYRWNIKLDDIDDFDLNWNEILNQDGRITCIWFNNIELLNVYFPNWWTRSDWREMLSYKLLFYDEIIKYVNKKRKLWKNIIITGDFNICHKYIDIARPEQNKNSIWFLPIEREKMSEFLNFWFIDAYRFFYPEKKDMYSRRSYRSNARNNNVWRRLDYFFVDEKFITNIKTCDIMTNIYWSDHCPVLLTF